MSMREAIDRQFEATWRGLRSTTEDIPAEQWTAGDVDYLRPARHVLHAIIAADGYCRSEPHRASWNTLTEQTFGRSIDWVNTPADQLPDQNAIRDYLDGVGLRIEAWLDGLSDEDLLEPQKEFLNTGPNILSRMIYVIRHTEGHIQIINAELRRRNLPRIKWQT